jgi:hypothetical protein
MLQRLYRSNIDIVPSLEIVHDDGRSTLALALPNRSDVRLWAEEAAITLAELGTTVERSVSTGTAAHLIRQFIEPQTSLEVSLAQTVYEAADRPQGHYDCIIFATVRFRSGAHWFERTAQQRRLQMRGLVPVLLQ